MAIPDRLVNEQALVQRLKEGDEKSVSELMDLYGSQLMRYLVSILGKREWAEDVFQDTWVKVMEKIRGFHSDAPFAPWLFRIARNGAYDLLRHNRRWLSVENTKDDAKDRPIEPHVMGNWAENLADQQIVQKLLVALEPAYREVLWLRFFQEMSYGEICQYTRLPMGTVKSRLFRALDQVAIMYQQMKGHTNGRDK